MTYSNEWKVKIYEDPSMDDFKVYILSTSPGDIQTYVSNAKTHEWKVRKDGEGMEPAMTLTRGMMQALFTALQGQGMKPIEQSYVEGKLEATEEHLKDMRRLAFGKEEMIITNTDNIDEF